MNKTMDVCHICQHDMEIGDKYCRSCGTKRAIGTSIPITTISNRCTNPECKTAEVQNCFRFRSTDQHCAECGWITTHGKMMSELLSHN